MKNLETGAKPLIAATLHLENELNILPALAAERIIDAVEFRADSFFTGDMEELRQILTALNKIGLPVILTFRKDEVPSLSETQRLEIILELLPHACAVDIEFDSEITGIVIENSKTLSKTVIISEHDFEKTPLEKDLNSIFEKGIKKGADIVKIAVMPNAPPDAAELMGFCLKSSKKHPVICISMGEIGRFTRFYAPFFGSRITYGFISEPIAPGQTDVRELRKEIGRFFKG